MSTDPSLERAIQALRNGDRETARALLQQCTQAEPLKSEGWLWLAAAQDDPTQKRACLQQALALNPDDHRAQAALRALEEQGVVQAASQAFAASAVQQQLIAETTPTPTSPASRLAQPRFAPTGVRARRISWPILALIGVLVLLIPLVLWLLGQNQPPQALADVTAALIVGCVPLRRTVEAVWSSGDTSAE
ncbi:MAG TPA: hypothetical protein VFZ66_00160 [Herpetosiphonaceae bacterium]